MRYGPFRGVVRGDRVPDSEIHGPRCDYRRQLVGRGDGRAACLQPPGVDSLVDRRDGRLRGHRRRQNDLRRPGQEPLQPRAGGTRVPADRLSGADDHLAAARERLVRRSVGRHAAGGREAGAGGSRRHRRAGDAAGQHPRFAGRGGRCGLAVRIRLPAVAARDHVAHSRDGARDDGCVRRGGCDVLRVVRRASAGCRRNLFGRL